MRSVAAHISAVLIGCAALLIQVDAIAGTIPRMQADSAAARFCRAIIGPGAVSYWDFEGKARQRMKPLLSRRLLAALDDVHSCVHDWAHHPGPNSSPTDKPPGVDCCIFSASADWSPTSFKLQQSKLLPDGRRRITIEYRFDSPAEHAHWHVAVYVVKEEGRYVVDDFEGGLDDAAADHWFALGETQQCKQGI